VNVEISLRVTSRYWLLYEEVQLQKADDAMYLAKKGGKNDYRLSPS